MKKSILIINLLFSLITFSQQNLNVEYNQIYNTASPRVRKAILQIMEQKSIYVDLMKTTKLLKSDEEILDQIKSKFEEDATHTSIELGSNDDQYYINDLTNNSFEFTDEIGKKKFWIVDNFKLNWQITNETKTIANYKVHKATIKFRGRIWEAWFTPDLPFSFGPWKLHGLPGLILEAYDESKTYNYVASKIYKENNILKVKNQKLEKMSLKKFNDLSKEYQSNFYNSIINGRDNFKVIKSNSKPKEFDFEWETEK